MFIGITKINPIRIIDTEKIWKLLINAESTDDLRDYWPLAYYGIWSDWHHSAPYSGCQNKEEREVYIKDYMRLRYERIYAMNRMACDQKNRLSNLPADDWLPARPFVDAGSLL